MTDIKTGRQTIDMGSLFTTAGVAFHIGASLPFSRFVHGAIGRHKYRDWGDCGHHDREVNDDALINGGRIISVYKLPDHISIEGESRIWIITEADRSYTTVLFPSEY